MEQKDERYAQCKVSRILVACYRLLLFTVSCQTLGHQYHLYLTCLDFMLFGRIRRTAELLTYIRTLKMYGWELLFASWLMKTRSLEVKHLSV